MDLAWSIILLCEVFLMLDYICKNFMKLGSKINPTGGKYNKKMIICFFVSFFIAYLNS